MNDNILKPYSTIEYITVNLIFKFIVVADKNCLIIKKNIKNTFRNVPVALKYQ